MEKRKIKAEVIADSLSLDGTRLTSFVLTFPRIVLAEFNTHRALSRNSASSRAIPFTTMLKMVDEDPFVPLRFQKNHSGMQGTEYLEGEDDELARELWVEASRSAMQSATNLTFLSRGRTYGEALAMSKEEFDEAAIVTKQLSNRQLEPYLWHTVIATGVNWGNYFALRAHDAAEIHIQELAYRMLDVYNESSPKKLKEGEWHIPFGDKFDDDRLYDKLPFDRMASAEQADDFIQDLKVKIATARCARVSYLNYEGKDDYNADVKLYHRLKDMGHMSPFEHCAYVPWKYEVSNYGTRSGNFSGRWTQLRKTFLDEEKHDPRIIEQGLTL